MAVPITSGVRPASDRIEKWDKKLLGDLLSQRVAQLKPAMKVKITTIFAQIVDFENATKVILDGEGISTTQYPFYLAYARQLFKIKRKFGGDTLVARALIILQRWVADGFTQAILENIAVTVFSIPIP